jgi:hypothetical protein
MEHKEYAPIVLFTFKRLDTLKLTVEALQKNYLAKKSDLIIFSDASNDESDFKAVENVRNYLKTIKGFNSINIFEAKENKGLANSIISGVTLVFETHESLIVLEDDLITTPNFLVFMNQAINEYKSKKKVFSICGYSFDLDVPDYQLDSYFLNRCWPWSWATWKDRWQEIDWEVKDYQEFLKNKSAQKKFAQCGSDVNAMLRKQMDGKLDSWAIRWTYHQYKVNGISLFPVQSKIKNEGFDDFATHTKGTSSRYEPKLDKGENIKFKNPEQLNISLIHQQKFLKKMGYASRIKSKIETLLLKLKKKI